MARYEVIARAYSKGTDNPATDSRPEIIDTLTNGLFHGANNVNDIKGRYEAFWAEDPSGPYDIRVEKVKKLSSP